MQTEEIYRRIMVAVDRAGETYWKRWEAERRERQRALLLELGYPDAAVDQAMDEDRADEIP